jgi:DNA polymerase III delta subunit
MPVATPGAVRKQIASGKPDAVYLLQGQDEVEKSALAAEFADLVDEGLRAFNTDRIHAGDLTTGDRLADGVASLVAAARTLPMMSPRRVVTVLQADPLLAPKRESEAATRALDELEALIKHPEPQTTLVLVAGSLDKRSRMYKLLLKHATTVECGAIEDQADAERWVRTSATVMAFWPSAYSSRRSMSPRRRLTSVPPRCAIKRAASGSISAPSAATRVRTHRSASA